MGRPWYTSALKLSPVPVSILAILLYGTAFSSVFLTDRTPDYPQNQGELSLSRAFSNLNEITARPHPFNSHLNDETHNFLLSRLESIANKHDWIHISNDLVSNASHVTDQHATFFESKNILIKIDGTETDPSEPDGVLFSAHFDSVQVGPGATDDAMGTVTMLELATMLANIKNRPRRTAVFLFNVGEEVGLNGSRMFLEHAWANLTTTFMNLEGAGAGGRPLVFRSTSLAPVIPFTSPAVTHPHANALGADGFNRGLIRSRTDFEVFAKGIPGEVSGMEGVDLSFYKNRALYHTPKDTIPGAGRSEARKSLWAMLEAARGAGLSLLNDDQPKNDEVPGVYFDILGKVLIAFSLRGLISTNIVFLVLGPITFIALLGYISIFQKGQPIPTSLQDLQDIWGELKTFFASSGWFRLSSAFLISVVAQVVLVLLYISINPFAIHANPNVILLTSLSLAFLSFVIPFTVLNAKRPLPANSQKLASFFHSYQGSWVFLLIATILSGELKLGGLYWVTARHITLWAGCILSLGEVAYKTQIGRGLEDDSNGIEPVAPRSNDHYGVFSHHAGGASNDSVDREASERTPLVAQGRDRSPALHGSSDTIATEGWWILQMLATIPIPVILIFQVQLLLIHSLGNTLVDGNNPIVSYAGVAFFSLLIFNTITPFAHLIHRALTTTILIVFVISLFYSLTVFPFTQDVPLKVWFQQTVELGLPPSVSGNPHSPIQGSVLRAVTHLSGAAGYIDKLVVPELPSSWGRDVNCIANYQRKGLTTCSWSSELMPSPGGHILPDISVPFNTSSRWIDVKATRLGPNRAIISVQGKNTRNCRIKFDEPISDFQIRTPVKGIFGSSSNSQLNLLAESEPVGRIQPGYGITEDGVKILTLFSRTWNNKFIVEFSWNSTETRKAKARKGDGNGVDAFEGWVGCEWDEYASAFAGTKYVKTRTSGEIPAVEELYKSLPLWTAVTKLTHGLVEAEGRFAV